MGDLVSLEALDAFGATGIDQGLAFPEVERRFGHPSSFDSEHTFSPATRRTQTPRRNTGA
jgi:hypothetical protein